MAHKKYYVNMENNGGGQTIKTLCQMCPRGVRGHGEDGQAPSGQADGGKAGSEAGNL